MRNVHLLVREIKDTYDKLGLPYTCDDLYNALISVYGLKPNDIESLNLKGYE